MYKPYINSIPKQCFYFSHNYVLNETITTMYVYRTCRISNFNEIYICTYSRVDQHSHTVLHPYIVYMFSTGREQVSIKIWDGARLIVSCYIRDLFCIHTYVHVTGSKHTRVSDNSKPDFNEHSEDISTR